MKIRMRDKKRQNKLNNYFLKSKWVWIFLPLVVGLIYFYFIMALYGQFSISSLTDILMIIPTVLMLLFLFPFAVLYFSSSIWAWLALVVYTIFVIWVRPKINNKTILWILLIVFALAIFTAIYFIDKYLPPMMLP
jgi:magnesium-transporting ATPase (P-type)